MSFSSFLASVGRSPALAVAALLSLAVLFVNGWTDAPNAIATAVSTGALSRRRAVRLAAVFNLLGVWVVTSRNASVALTVTRAVDFGGGRRALLALCAAMTAIVLWAVAAWCFGIPTSESHALAAGLAGAAVAAGGGLSALNGSEWRKIAVGLVLSVALGFSLGFASSLALGWASARWTKGAYTRRFRAGQIGGAAAMAFMHGAQDGQKFMAVFLLGGILGGGGAVPTDLAVPPWLILLTAAVMAAGTAVGGRRILDKIGGEMVRLAPHQGLAADAGSALALLVCSLFGIPAGTTHAKVTAMMGAAAAESRSRINGGVVRELVATWLATFPGCGALGYLLCKLFLACL